eukprot:350699-Chlamydomonas_euryale.AAC.5
MQVLCPEFDMHSSYRSEWVHAALRKICRQSGGVCCGACMPSLLNGACGLCSVPAGPWRAIMCVRVYAWCLSEVIASATASLCSSNSTKVEIWDGCGLSQGSNRRHPKNKSARRVSQLHWPHKCNMRVSTAHEVSQSCRLKHQKSNAT